MKPHALRLKPGQDLKKALLAYCQSHSLKAGFVIGGIGSLKTLNIRLADSTSQIQSTESFEILSLQGSLTELSVHLHISVADSEGHSWGGHLLNGCEVYTTAEILILELSDLEFSRQIDPMTGYSELVVKPKNT